MYYQLQPPCITYPIFNYLLLYLYTCLSLSVNLSIKNQLPQTCGSVLVLLLLLDFSFDLCHYQLPPPCYPHFLIIVSLKPKAKDTRNYKSCCSCRCLRPILLHVGFSIWSMPYQLPPLCYPNFYYFIVIILFLIYFLINSFLYFYYFLFIFMYELFIHF